MALTFRQTSLVLPHFLATTSIARAMSSGGGSRELRMRKILEQKFNPAHLEVHNVNETYDLIFVTQVHRSWPHRHPSSLPHGHGQNIRDKAFILSSVFDVKQPGIKICSMSGVEMSECYHDLSLSRAHLRQNNK